MKILATIGALTGLTIIGYNTCTYTVNESEHAVVTRFGHLKQKVNNMRGDEAKLHEEVENSDENITIHNGPGIYWKWPIDSARKIDNRLRITDTDPERVLTNDKKDAFVDYAIIWQVVEPWGFIQRLKTDDSAADRLDTQVYGALYKTASRNSLLDLIRTTNEPLYLGDEATNKNGASSAQDGLSFERRNLEAVVKTGRTGIFAEVLNSTRDGIHPDWGIIVNDIYPIRVDFAPENEPTIFDRMRSERLAVAQELRAKGKEEYARIQSEAILDASRIRSQANQNALEIRGNADAKSMKILIDGFTHTPETTTDSSKVGQIVRGYGADFGFFQLYEQARMIEKITQGGSTTVIMDPKMPIFSILSYNIQDGKKE